MNFTINTELGQKPRTLVVATEVDSRIYNIKEILGSAHLTNNIFLSSDEGVNFPFLICEEPQYNRDITSIYKMAEKIDFKLEGDMRTAVVSKLASVFTAEQVDTLFVACREFKSYLDGDKVQIKMEPTWFTNYELTAKLVDECNNSGKAKNIYIEGENKTLFRENPEDELFLRVPSYEELAIDYVAPPNFATIERPYPIAELATIDYRKYLPADYPVEWVLGNAENNTLGIQPNEERYRNALRALMDYGIQKERPEVPLEQCLKDNIGSKVVIDYIKSIAQAGAGINWRHTGMIPLDIEAILCGGISEYDDSFNSEADDDVADTGVEYGTGTFPIEVQNQPGWKNAIPYLEQVIDIIASENLYAIIDFAIMLFRFGGQKPTRISLGTGKWLDLNSMTIMGSSGNYSTTEIREDAEGNNLIPIGSIVMQDYMSDNAYIEAKGIKSRNIALPVGIICKREYVNTEEYQRVCISFIDIIKAYENNEPMCKIKGIRVVDGEIEMDEEVNNLLTNSSVPLRDIITRVNGDNNGVFCFYQYQGFIDAFFTKQCFDKKLSVLRIWNDNYSSQTLSQLDSFAYDTIEELDANLIAFQIPPRECIQLNMARYLIPILCKVNEMCEKAVLTQGVEPDVHQILYMFKVVCDSMGFLGVYGQGATIDTPAPQTSTSFNNIVESSKPVEVQSEKPTVGGAEMFINSNIEGYTINKIYLTEEIYNSVKAECDADGTELNVIDVVVKESSTNPGATQKMYIIGYVAMHPTDKKAPKILLNPKNAYQNAVRRMNTLKLIKAFSADIRRILLGGNPPYVFDSADTGVYYCKVLDKTLAYALKDYLPKKRK